MMTAVVDAPSPQPARQKETIGQKDRQKYGEKYN